MPGEVTARFSPCQPGGVREGDGQADDNRHCPGGPPGRIIAGKELLLMTERDVDPVIKELQRRAQNVPALQPLLPVYEKLLRMEEEVEVPSLELARPPSTAAADLETGIFLLHDVEPPILAEAMGAVWRQVSDLATAHLVEHAATLKEMREWPEVGREEWLERMRDYFHTGQVAADDETRDLWVFLLVHTWRPFLRRWAAELAPLIDDAAWKKNHCPFCGGQPDLACLGMEGERYLVCSRCDTEWRYKRLGCVFCDNNDSSTYGYYPYQEGRYRLYGCKNCSRYLKVLDRRQAGGEWVSAVERIATIEMDMSALQAGYKGS
ncbi:MAG: formate dehydrogenase accessory protein FdhE [Anaerolineae bacterium]|nr:formate dehydrogenase accessory protein FdhE [Anaerolineae bacterium]